MTHDSTTEPRPKSIDEHARFLEDYVRLQLWFVWTWLSTHPDEGFREVLRGRVDILRKTNLNPGLSKNTRDAGDFSDPRWIELEGRAFEVYRRHRNTDAGRFEDAAWSVFRPVVEARVERDFLESDGLDDYQCGSLRYHDLPRLLGYRVMSGLSYLRHGRGRTVFFHIGNPISPRSIFADRAYLPQCFFQLMRETRRRFRAGALTTTTWLNSYPRWLDLFPPQWQENMSPATDEVDWSQSSWGQFITARGTLNYKHAAILRQTARLPFPSRSSWCSFSQMESHLGDYLAGSAVTATCRNRTDHAQLPAGDNKPRPKSCRRPKL